MVNESRVREHYRSLTSYLIEKGITIATMESATSGQLASLITDTEGASAIFKGAYITYSNEIKIKHGVPAETIEEYGVYSNETSNAMALAAKRAFDTDIAVGITGTMGNVDPANKDSVPGEIYFSIAYGKQVFDFYRSMDALNDRLSYKLAVADEIYGELSRLLEEKING